jgi:hypothetical protein
MATLLLVIALLVGVPILIMVILAGWAAGHPAACAVMVLPCAIIAFAIAFSTYYYSGIWPNAIHDQSAAPAVPIMLLISIPGGLLLAFLPAICRRR